MSSSLLDVLHSDFIKSTKAKGLSVSIVTYRHGIRNAIIHVVSFLGLVDASILFDNLIVKKIFAILGLGNEFMDSITNRDYNVIMGTNVFYSIILLVSILIIDLIYGLIDPRIKINPDKGDR